MKNNVLGKVSMKTAALPSSRFNLANDVETTLQFGVVYPTHAKYCHEGTNKVDSRESLVYLAPMPVRTFGRLKAKMYHQFVAFEDLFPKLFPSVIAQTPVATAVEGNIKPGYLPFVEDSRILSSYALLGSKLSVWLGTDYTNTIESSLPSYDNIPEDSTVYSLTEKVISGQGYATSPEYTAFTTSEYNGTGQYNSVGTAYLTIFSNSSSHRTSSWSDTTKNVFGCKLPNNTLLLNPHALFAPQGQALPVGTTPASVRDTLIPLGVDNSYGCTADYSFNHGSSLLNMKKQGYDTTFYNPANSDVVVTRFIDYTTTSNSVTTYHRRRIYYCFRLSDYGKRFKCFLEGCGYKLNFAYKKSEGLTTLLACYKAYYDLFAINLYENFENSNLGKLCNYIDNGGFWSTLNDLGKNLDTCNFGTDIKDGLLGRIVYAFGDTFYTEEQDYLSSHIPNTGVSASARGIVDVNYDVDGSAHIAEYDNQTPQPYGTTTGQPHAYIDSVTHGQLDSEFLMKAYRWVNRNTIAGQRIAQLLRAQGLGDYVDSCKSNFIGYDEIQLKIDSILAQADTYQSGSGAQLGQRAGVGVGYNDGKKVFKFTNNELGLTISFITIVPNSGYCQGSDPVTTRLIRKADFYQPDFDALGYEATEFDSIVDTMKSDGSDITLSKVFGLAPRMSKFKVSRNKLMGSFSLPSEQDDFLPYCLDKFIPLNKLICEPHSTQQPYPYDIRMTLVNPLQFSAIPSCGVAWRYIGKYMYLQNFNRIFSYVGSTGQLASSVVGNNWSEYVVRDADNFILQQIDNDQSYARMKPIEDSYETDDDGKTDTSMDKA